MRAGPPGDVVDVAPGGGDHQRAALVGGGRGVVEGEVPQAVVDIGGAEVAASQQHVGVAADDDVGPGLHQHVGQGLLQGVRAGVELHAPVEEDDHGVVDLAGGLHRRHQVGDVVGGGQPGLGGGGRPGGLEVGVDHLGGGDDADLLPVEGGLVGGEGLGGVLADAEDGVAGLGAGGQRHLQALRSAVLPVVVGLGDQAHPGRLQGGEGGGRGVEVVGLGLGRRAGAVGEGRLEVDHREVHPGQQLRDPGTEGGGRVGGQAVAEGAARRQVHIPAEGERHRLPVALPLRVEVGVGGRHRGGRTVGMVRRGGGGRVAAAHHQPDPQGEEGGQEGRRHPPVAADPPGDRHRVGRARWTARSGGCR